jgi:tripartite-type tricarboxylate transporter receptor subunit TctC
MKTLLVGIVLALSSSLAYSSDIIKIFSPYSPGHSGTPALRKIIDQANESQAIYKFVLEFKPGGNQIIAVKSIDPDNSLAIIAPAYVENITSGKLVESDYVPIYSLGDACWAVITNKPLAGQKEFVVGGVGFGNAAHLTALSLGQKYNFQVRFVVFKSNFDALVNMAASNGVEFVIDKYENYQSLKTKNPKLQMVAASCPTRLPQEPKIKTIKELGVDAPYIFNIVIAHKDMPTARQKAISAILNSASTKIGGDEIYKLSAMKPPGFSNITDEQFYTNSVNQLKKLQLKYENAIQIAKQGN